MLVNLRSIFKFLRSVGDLQTSCSTTSMSLGRGPMESCSHGEKSIILPKQDVFLHHVVTPTRSARHVLPLSFSLSELLGQYGGGENGPTHERSVRHSRVLFLRVRESVHAKTKHG